MSLRPYNFMSFQKYKKTLQAKKVILVVAGLFAVLFFVYFSRISYKLGDVFFGQVPKLYNVTLANLFFKQAAYPPFGKAVPYAHHQLSRTYFIQGHLDQALLEAKEEFAVYPDHLATYYVLALTLGYMNHPDEAIDAFSKYTAYNPNSWAARNDKAWLQFRIGDIDGAVETLAWTADSQIHNVWVQNTYCVLMINKKEYEKAKNACTYAQDAIATITEESWGKAYPGNDPRIYSTGLQAMKTSINNNLSLAETKLSKKKQLKAL